MNIKLIAMLDNIALTTNALYGVPISAEQIARRYAPMTERASDDLDYFDFIGLDVDGVRLGFRTYIRSPAKTAHALVAIIPHDFPDAVNLIARIAGLKPADVEPYDKPW